MTYTRCNELPPIKNLHVEHVTTDSARIAWQPHDSEVAHDAFVLSQATTNHAER